VPPYTPEYPGLHKPENELFGHVTHVFGSVAAKAVEHRPCVHDVHDALPVVFLYVPRRQAVQGPVCMYVCM
jgi:hypothetical protein